MWLFFGISAIIFTGSNLVFSTASAEDNIRNPRLRSGISYIGSNAQSLVDRGASAIRVWTPAVHKLVVLHDKGARRILSP